MLRQNPETERAHQRLREAEVARAAEHLRRARQAAEGSAAPGEPETDRGTAA